MRYLTSRLPVALLIVAVMVTPARAQDPPPPADGPTTLSLTVRFTPANLWKVAGDLRQMMNEGVQPGQPLLKDLLGILTAEVSLERGPRPAAPSDGIRASSDPLVRALESGPASAAQTWQQQRDEIGRQADTSGLGLAKAYAEAVKAVGEHTAVAVQAGRAALDATRKLATPDKQ